MVYPVLGRGKKLWRSRSRSSGIVLLRYARA